MADPRQVRPDEVEVLVARELRKAGLELSTLRVHARRPLADGASAASSAASSAEYSTELAGVSAHEGRRRAVLVEFRNQSAPVAVASVQALSERAAAPPPPDGPVRLMPGPGASPVGQTEDPPKPRLGVMFSTSSYEPAAVREAMTLGIALLAVADGPAAFRRSQWAMGQQTPAWVPEYMAELVDLAPDGSVRRRLLVSGKSALTDAWKAR